MKKIRFVICFCLCYSICFGQSLIQDCSGDSNCIYQNAFMMIKEPKQVFDSTDRTIFYSHLAYRYAQTQQQKLRAYNVLTGAFLFQRNFMQFRPALDTLFQLADIPSNWDGYKDYMIGVFWYSCNDYKKANKHLEICSRKAEKFKNDTLLAPSFHLRGEIALKYSQYESANYLFQEAIKIYHRNNCSSPTTIGLWCETNNILLTDFNFKLEHFRFIDSIIKQDYQKKVKLNNRIFFGHKILITDYAYLAVGKYERDNLVIKTYKSLKDRLDTFQNILNRNEDLKRNVELYSDSTRNLLLNMTNIRKRSEHYKALTTVYSDSNRNQQMILNQKERDIEEKDRELEKQKKELDSAKEEFKNVEKQKEEAITTRNSAIVVAIVVFVLAVGLAVRQRNKLQKETDLIKVERDQVKAEKEQLERDFGSNKELIEKLQVNVEEKIHRSGNNIKSLVAMVKGIKKNYREKPEITAALDRVFERANKLHNITSYIAAIEEKGDPVKVKSLIDNILKEFKGTIGDFDLDYDFVCNPEIEFVRDKNLNIARIVNEICTNSVKHAFIDFPCENPTIFVKFYLEGDKYNLIIGDNGKGLNQAAAKKSYGAKIIDKCIQALKGEYNIDSNNGTIYNITF